MAAVKWMLARVAVGCFGLLLVMAHLASGQQGTAGEKHPKFVIAPVPIEAGTAKIGPQNTRIEFIGLHTGADPKPRLGGFREFDGVLVVDEGRLTAISVEIAIESIWTEFDKLTQHLQAADFLNAKEYPTAKFRSTAIEPGPAGGVKVTGKLTLHGTESEVVFPAKVHVSEQGLVLKSEFKLDRTAFGMQDHLDGVEKLVSVSVVVGEPTERGSSDDERKAQASVPVGPAPESGLAVGQSVEPWTPVHVAGPDKGTRTCPVCNYLGRPAIVVFAKQGPNTEQLLSAVEQMVAEHQQHELKGFVAVTDASPAALQQMAEQNVILLTSLCYPDAKTGAKDLAAYRVNPDCDNTVMIYDDYKVVANFVDLDAGDVAQLRAAVAKMLAAGG